MKLRSLLPFLKLPRLGNNQQIPRHSGYVFLHSSNDHHLLAASRQTSAIQAVLHLSILTVLLAAPLSFFFHTLSTLFIYLSLVVFALPVTSILLAPSSKARSVLSFIYLLFCILTLGQIHYAFRLDVLNQPSDPNPGNQFKVFIASNLHNNQQVLPFYSKSLQLLIQRLGVDNTFVSIYESHSKDKTKQLLSELDDTLNLLGAPHRILMDDKQVKVGLGDHRNGRIEFLSYVRNVAMEPLQELSNQGFHFTHVLWINDVYFHPDALIELLSTDHGQYDQACALDYIGNGFYDVWVMRDTEDNTGKRAWPYFVGAKQIAGLLADQPFLVNACWNGATAFDAKWFLDSSSASGVQQTDRKEMSGPYSHPYNTTTVTRGPLLDINPDIEEPPVVLPLRFRSSPRCFSSECQLISFDIHRAVAPLRPRIWINPRIAVAYELRTYFQYIFLQRWWVVAPWRVIWRDGAGMLIGKLYSTWPNLCAGWQNGWAAANATLASTSYSQAHGAAHQDSYSSPTV